MKKLMLTNPDEGFDDYGAPLWIGDNKFRQ